MKVGDKIRLLREAQNISTKTMADELDMSLGGYLKIERNDVDINTEKIEKIAHLLHTTPSNLLAIDEKLVFNFTQSDCKNNGYNVYNFPDEIRQFYEEKIKLLEQNIALLQDKINYQQEFIDRLKK